MSDQVIPMEEYLKMIYKLSADELAEQIIDIISNIYEQYGPYCEGAALAAFRDHAKHDKLRYESNYSNGEVALLYSVFSDNTKPEPAASVCSTPKVRAKGREKLIKYFNQAKKERADAKAANS